jgi:hypothetical protein
MIVGVYCPEARRVLLTRGPAAMQSAVDKNISD